ncbi:ComEA family DNA-binding protein [Saccharopolyspora sp. HNM0983]|uniref:ComEA family DNA-binding protein n=1 Tax=Saccharopolyspora montiporae TaxID=2781240 RepID=A0A929G076_9PSEU|nr:ComEA family DNA-binding protein [Saccharopolyspora sp. HNM0983]MBE9374527.1 ComEA family DNA-binding protein [Saccharopolyspora sp. HNM0983]
MLDIGGFRSTGEVSANAADRSPRNRLRDLHRDAGSDTAEQRCEPGYTAPDREPEPPSAVRRFALRWLPASLVESRVDPGRPGVLAVAVVAMLALAGFGVFAWTSRPVAEPAPPPPPVSPPPHAEPPPPEKVVVSVVGRVREPGLVTVRPGERVADALVAAGGPLPETDITALNLARRLADGEQLHVGIPPPPQSEQSREDGKVDLNSADAEELQELPGVGESTAQQIVRWRTDHDGFASVGQLREVDGIGESRFSELRDLVRS